MQQLEVYLLLFKYIEAVTDVLLEKPATDDTVPFPRMRGLRINLFPQRISPTGNGVGIENQLFILKDR